VAYLEKEQVKGELFEVAANVRDNREFLRSLGREQLRNRVYNMFVAGATCVKHEGFKEEREWRLIYAPNRWPSHLIERSTEVVRGIPQIVYKIPLAENTLEAPNAIRNLDLARLFHHSNGRMAYRVKCVSTWVPQPFVVFCKGLRVFLRLKIRTYVWSSRGRTFLITDN
jgi:hypothetical protein